MNYIEAEKKVIELIKNGVYLKEVLASKTDLTVEELELLIIKLSLEKKIKLSEYKSKCDCSSCPLKNRCPLKKIIPF